MSAADGVVQPRTLSLGRRGVAGDADHLEFVVLEESVSDARTLVAGGTEDDDLGH